MGTIYVIPRYLAYFTSIKHCLCARGCILAAHNHPSSRPLALYFFTYLCDSDSLVMNLDVGERF
jgi:hypothetical protein